MRFFKLDLAKLDYLVAKTAGARGRPEEVVAILTDRDWAYLLIHHSRLNTVSQEVFTLLMRRTYIRDKLTYCLASRHQAERARVDVALSHADKYLFLQF
jgi:hypothetical protein